MQVSLRDEEEKAMALLLESQKAQERVAIQALVTINKTSLQARSTQVQTTLTKQAEKMKNFAGNTLPLDLEGGFKGRAADAAKDYLFAVPQPDLTSPIK